MSDKVETVAAIMQEFKAAVEAVGPGESVNEDWLMGIPGRVLAAHQHEVLVATRRNEDTFGAIVEKCDKLEADNAKMREALKDVLDVHLLAGATQTFVDALCAVAKAKKIMKGGAK